MAKRYPYFQITSWTRHDTIQDSWLTHFQHTGTPAALIQNGHGEVAVWRIGEEMVGERTERLLHPANNEPITEDMSILKAVNGFTQKMAIEEQI